MPFVLHSSLAFLPVALRVVLITGEAGPDGLQSRVPVLSWHGHLLSSGCRDGSIHHHDVRVARHKVGELQGHTGEVRLILPPTLSNFWLD